MGHLPAEVRAMTPLETDDLVAGWNDAHAGEDPGVMSADEFAELVEKYG